MADDDVSNRDQRIRYIVVGLGNIAQVAVLPAFAHAKDDCELVGLVSSDAQKLEELSNRYHVGYSSSYDQFEVTARLAQADAVYLSVPNAMHRELTERAAAIGLHVLCEKPMATSVEDCEAMIEATRAAGVQLMVAYRLHFDRANMRVLERIRKGEIGEVRAFSSVFSHDVRGGDVRTHGSLGGGALFDLGVYCVNAARHVFDAEPKGVQAFQGAGTGDVDAVSAALLDFGEGRFAQLVCHQGASDVSEYRVVGTRGNVRLEPAYEYSVGLEEHLTIEGSSHHKGYWKHDQFAPELIHFSESILAGTEPEPSGEEGLCDVRVLQAIRLSARTGRRAELAPYARADRPGLDQAMRKPPVGKVEAIHAPSPSK
jgi:predicted dehydrogenase